MIDIIAIQAQGANKLKKVKVPLFNLRLKVIVLDKIIPQVKENESIADNP